MSLSTDVCSVQYLKGNVGHYSTGKYERFEVDEPIQRLYILVISTFYITSLSCSFKHDYNAAHTIGCACQSFAYSRETTEWPVGEYAKVRNSDDASTPSNLSQSIQSLNLSHQSFQVCVTFFVGTARLSQTSALTICFGRRAGISCKIVFCATTWSVSLSLKEVSVYKVLRSLVSFFQV